MAFLFDSDPFLKTIVNIPVLRQLRKYVYTVSLRAPCRRQAGKSPDNARHLTPSTIIMTFAARLVGSGFLLELNLGYP
jgi:hypothetical protein